MRAALQARSLRRRVRITPATVISMVALVFAAGGGAYAAVTSATVSGWAVVKPNGKLARSSGATSSSLLKLKGKVYKGDYQVVFGQNVSKCNFEATLGSSGTSKPAVGDIGVATRTGNPDAVYVRTVNHKGYGADEGFHLVVLCS